MKVDIAIGQLMGPNDPPPIQITVKDGRTTLIRVEMTPEDFALCLTGRLVQGIVTRADKLEPTKPAELSTAGTVPVTFSVVEAAEVSGVGRSFFYQAIGAGQLPVFKVGRKTRVFERDLLAWMNTWKQKDVKSAHISLSKHPTRDEDHG